MKQTIKKLAQAVAEVLHQNYIANEMGAMIDAGEWSQSGPDFSRLVQNWRLTRYQLLQYVREAERLAKLFWDHKPARKAASPSRRPFEYYPYNPWEDRLENLNCIFMAGELQSERRGGKTILQERKEAGEHLLDEEYWNDPY